MTICCCEKCKLWFDAEDSDKEILIAKKDESGYKCIELCKECGKAVHEALANIIGEKDSFGLYNDETVNISPENSADGFTCLKCGIALEEWRKLEADDEGNAIVRGEYEFKYCPECGRKVVDKKL